MFENVFERVCTDFCNHSLPIVEQQQVEEFIEEAPVIYGTLWTLMLDLRDGGEVIHQPGSQREVKAARSADDKKHAVFFELLTMTRMANRQRLLHWALVTNIANFARGVGRAVESAFAYFGGCLCDRARRQTFARIMGDDAKGRATNNTWLRKIMRRLCRHRALILCYDNYQRGVTLQHQRLK